MEVDVIGLLSEGDKRTVHNVDRVVEYALSSTQAIPNIIAAMKSSDEGLAMRAADATQKVFATQPKLVKPYTSDLFELLLACSQKEIRWHLAQIMPGLPMTDDQLRRAAAVWREDFYNSDSSIVKTFSLQAMYDISKKNPDVQALFDEMVADALDKGTPAMKSRARKLLSTHYDGALEQNGD